MDRFKTYNATGIAPNGRLFAGDLNLFQDLVAALADFDQIVQANSLEIGDSGIVLSKVGAGEIQWSAALRTTGILRGLGGLFAGTFTTIQRNAITLPPYGLIILNVTTNQHEWNKGSTTVPDWQPIFPGVADGSITTVKLQDSAVTGPKISASAVDTGQMADSSVSTSKLQNLAVTLGKIANGIIDATKLAASLKPSGSAAAGDEALRALGTTGSTAAAGNDGRLSDTRVPTNLSVTSGKIANGAVGQNQLATRYDGGVSAAFNIPFATPYTDVPIVFATDFIAAPGIALQVDASNADHYEDAEAPWLVSHGAPENFSHGMTGVSDAGFTARIYSNNGGIEMQGLVLRWVAIEV